jgi:iron-sulfur cluster repair protein YtfE (RIC family)
MHNENIIEQLKNDHQKLLNIMDQLEKMLEAGSENCGELFQAFKDTFSIHDQVEDKILYPALKNYPELKKLVLKGYQAHHMVEIGILELRLLPYTSETWGPRFLVIKDSILSHMKEEEELLFPQIIELINPKDLACLTEESINLRENR